jgi:thiamine-phosphate pyrophosphorylase
MLVTGWHLCRHYSLEKIVRLSCRYGIDFIQLREKDVTSRDLLQLANRISIITKKYKRRLIINDRLDIALLMDADGVHSPANGIPVKYVKKYGLLCGKSTHSLIEAKQAEKAGYNYIVFGPIFSTPSKAKYGAPLGVKMLAEVCQTVRLPVLAIGGITPERASKCIQAGASGIAVRGAILRARNVPEVVGRFKKCLTQSK